MLYEIRSCIYCIKAASNHVCIYNLRSLSSATALASVLLMIHPIITISLPKLIARERFCDPSLWL